MCSNMDICTKILRVNCQFKEICARFYSKSIISSAAGIKGFMHNSRAKDSCCICLQGSIGSYVFMVIECTNSLQ